MERRSANSIAPAVGVMKMAGRSVCMKAINNPWFAILVPAVFGFGLTALCVRGFEFYGWSLFLGLPLAVSFMSAFFTSYRRQVRFVRAYGISILSLLALGALIVILALDGLICLLMAFPLAMILAVFGATVGWSLGGRSRGGMGTALPLLLMFLLPGLVAFDHATVQAPPLRAVVTQVVIDAPVERVWETVVAFPKITDPPDGIFRCGIAYPIEARIDGTGVGAVRHCIFSTGSFVEPITTWDEPRLLAFDVRESPPPLKELSFHEELNAPHLHGHMASEKGQFRLIEGDGKVTLEGTTWYRHSLAPQWYWGPITDFMIHRIHERVLNHIERSSESSP